MNLAQAAGEIIGVGQYCHRQGWVPATSGNFSRRLSPSHFAVTASGVHKGALQPSDILQSDLEGKVMPAHARPSAETLLHCQLYRMREDIQAVLHTHSPRATVLSMTAGATLYFEDMEILKAFEGIHTHETGIEIPVFNNDQNMPRLAEQVNEYLQSRSAVAYLIRGHGTYTWGRDMQSVQRHLEALEFLFECQLLLGRNNT